MDSLQPLPAYQRAISRWLFVCTVLVVLMVFIGGVTRLTESGLSIVEWKLVSGTLPPMNAAAWQAEFDAYKQTPQFQKVNTDFTLSDFKGIFWLEYLHRLLGRIIGMVVVLPLLYFAARRILPRRLLLRGLGIAALVGAQGAVGWIMVASGLNDQPRVEPIKLAAHLLLAFTVFALMLWTRWQVLDHPRGVFVSSGGKPSPSLGGRLDGGSSLRAPTSESRTTNPHPTLSLRRERALALAARGVLALLLLQIFFGALVAGLRAGLTYNTYPLMDGQFIPDGMHLMHPWWLNHLESPLTVQFQHRIGAMAVAAAMIALVMYAKNQLTNRRLLNALLIATLSQFGLGVATLLTGVHPWLASAHQLVALALVGLLVRLLYLTPLAPAK